MTTNDLATEAAIEPITPEMKEEILNIKVSNPIVIEMDAYITSHCPSMCQLDGYIKSSDHNPLRPLMGKRVRVKVEEII